MTDPYTPGQMDAAARAGAEPLAGRFDGLHAEAKAALTYSANTLRTIRDRYRELYAEELGRWQALRDGVDRVARRPLDGTAGDGHDPAAAAEIAAEDARIRALRADADEAATDLATHQAELGRIELAIRNLESTWLFLERGDSTLVGGDDEADTKVQMRIVEAQEAERSRLAQEVHDGPAQSLSNAIFQVEYIERILGRDPRLAATELRFLRELLRRELGDVRSFITQLRPPVLDELGLDGALSDAIAHSTALTGIPITADLVAPPERLVDGEQTVVLRIAQEALQNVRKHASASAVSVATRIEDDAWVLEIRDDGRGFDVGAVAARGRRNFGLQFMRERAELIGARLDVRSRPDGGTIVRLAIPMGA
jgi:two-component system, NarL family, sensor histidine kinase DegS